MATERLRCLFRPGDVQAPYRNLAINALVSADLISHVFAAMRRPVPGLVKPPEAVSIPVGFVAAAARTIDHPAVGCASPANMLTFSLLVRDYVFEAIRLSRWDRAAPRATCPAVELEPRRVFCVEEIPPEFPEVGPDTGKEPSQHLIELLVRMGTNGRRCG